LPKLVITITKQLTSAHNKPNHWKRTTQSLTSMKLSTLLRLLKNYLPLLKQILRSSRFLYKISLQVYAVLVIRPPSLHGTILKHVTLNLP